MVKIVTKFAHSGHEDPLWEKLQLVDQKSGGLRVDAPAGLYAVEKYDAGQRTGLFNLVIVDSNGDAKVNESYEYISNYCDTSSLENTNAGRIIPVYLKPDANRFKYPKLVAVLPENTTSNQANDDLYETYVATTTDNPKLTKQEYANQITQLYRILRTI